MRMTTPDHSKWLVALCAKVFERDQISRSEIVQCPDPSTGELRSYALVVARSRPHQKRLVEFQKLAADFSSYFVGRHVVEDGSLYVLNVVDPLFFVLASAPTETNKSNSRWQPLDQTLDHLMENSLIRECIVPEQLGNICQLMCNDQTDNVAYYKFSPEKATEWLQKKQERVFQCLLRQHQQQSKNRQALLAKRPQSATTAGNTGGSTSRTFYAPEEERPPQSSTSTTNTSSDEVISPQTLKQFKMESLQIVCNYLTEEWTTKFLASMELTEADVWDVTSSTKSKTSTPNYQSSSSVTTTPAKVTPKNDFQKKQPRLEAPRSVANKQLQKVNKRGMASLTSFFGPVKKNKQESK